MGTSKPGPSLATLDAWFAEFWQEYPKKRSKWTAYRRFLKVCPDRRTFEELMAGLEIAKRSHQWRKQNGTFIPYPATWLHAGGWMDDLSDDAPEPSLADTIRRHDQHAGVL